MRSLSFSARSVSRCSIDWRPSRSSLTPLPRKFFRSRALFTFRNASCNLATSSP
jgi:hypothetical protein